MSSHSSTANHEEIRARKGKTPMIETELTEPKEERNERVVENRIFLTEEQQRRFEYAVYLPIASWKFIDLATLNPFQCRNSLACLIHQPFWSKIFGWRHSTYIPTVFEFVATLEVTGKTGDLKSPTIKFNLFNEPHHISVNTLGILLGFYTEEDQESMWYKELPIDFGDSETPRNY